MPLPNLLFAQTCCAESNPDGETAEPATPCLAHPSSHELPDQEAQHLMCEPSTTEQTQGMGARLPRDV